MIFVCCIWHLNHTFINYVILFTTISSLQLLHWRKRICLTLHSSTWSFVHSALPICRRGDVLKLPSLGRVQGKYKLKNSINQNKNPMCLRMCFVFSDVQISPSKTKTIIGPLGITNNWVILIQETTITYTYAFSAYYYKSLSGKILQDIFDANFKWHMLTLAYEMIGVFRYNITKTGMI